MSDKKFYYVIGGEYTDANFTQLRAGTSTMKGPFASQLEAKDSWQSLSQSSTGNVLERYDIVELSHTLPREALLGLGR